MLDLFMILYNVLIVIDIIFIFTLTRSILLNSIKMIVFFFFFG